MNYILIVVVLLAAGIGVYYYIKNKQNQEVEETIEMDDKTYTLERMTAFVKQRLNEITKVNLYDIGLSEEELKRRKNKKYELKKALKGCTYGDVNDKKYIKELIYDLLYREYGVDETNVSKAIPFDIPSLLTAQDKFDILIYMYKNDFGYEALTELIKKYNLAELKYVAGETKPCYVITSQEISDIFEKENPEINVKCKYGVWNGYEKRQHIYMKSQETPDVMLINYGWLDTYSSDGSGFYDLNTLSDYIDFENYTEEELAFGTKNGRLNAVPIAFNTETFYYNETLWNSYGLSIPRTWDDLFDAARIMSKDGVYPLGMTKKSLFFMLLSHYIQTTGNDPVKSDGTLNLNKEQIGDMLDFYKELLDKKVLMSVDSFNRNAFASGEVGGTLAWVSDAGGYCDPLKENGYDVKIGEYICEPGAKSLGWFVKPATMYAISNNTEHPEAAAKLLNYLLNGEEMTLRQGTEKGVPISSSALAVLDEHDMLTGFEVQADAMRKENSDKLSIMAPILESEDVYGSFKSDSDYYLYDKLSRDETIDRIYSDMYKE